MSHPSKLLSRARMQRRRPIPHPAAGPRVPAPQPAPQAAQPPAPVEAPPPAPAAAPRPSGGHALYSALMRSHDRMGTRHLTDGK